MNVCPSLIVNIFDFIGEEGRNPSSFFFINKESYVMNRKRTL
ncbi:hypothetical protein bcere0026_52460 [Bacillus mycoides]|uniref:Uncharacterized protein n=1 Tax=Bacillus mycoides TaxID=1405 RepID=C2Y2P9_BACMY|nr:hypothetical protein bcere0026_52460 [Bacillus mycoides]